MMPIFRRRRHLDMPADTLRRHITVRLIIDFHTIFSAADDAITPLMLPLLLPR